MMIVQNVKKVIDNQNSNCSCTNYSDACTINMFFDPSFFFQVDIKCEELKKGGNHRKSVAELKFALLQEKKI